MGFPIDGNMHFSEQLNVNKIIMFASLVYRLCSRHFLVFVNSELPIGQGGHLPKTCFCLQRELFSGRIIPGQWIVMDRWTLILPSKVRSKTGRFWRSAGMYPYEGRR